MGEAHPSYPVCHSPVFAIEPLVLGLSAHPNHLTEGDMHRWFCAQSLFKKINKLIVKLRPLICHYLLWAAVLNGTQPRVWLLLWGQVLLLYTLRSSQLRKYSNDYLVDTWATQWGWYQFYSMCLLQVMDAARVLACRTSFLCADKPHNTSPTCMQHSGADLPSRHTSHELAVIQPYLPINVGSCYLVLPLWLKEKLQSYIIWIHYNHFKVVVWTHMVT